MSLTNKAVAGVVTLVFVAYAWVLLSLSPLLLGDYPNHLARAVAMADLIFHHGDTFGATFGYHLLIAPYVLGDWILASLVELLGVSTAASLFTLLVFLSLPCALIAYLRATRTAADATLMMLLLSAYLSTDTFFALGFLSFRLGIAVLLFALATVELLRREWSAVWFAAFVLTVAIAYVTHFAAVVFIAAALGTTAIVRLYLRTSRIDREIVLFVPVACALAWHLLVEGGFRQPQDAVAEAFFWGTPATKLAHLFWNFLRYKRHWDELLMATLAVCMLFWVWARGGLARRAFLKPNVLEPWGMAVAFLGVYIALPSTYSEASIVDVRALTPAWLWVVLGVLNLPDRTRPVARLAGALAVSSAVLLAVLNLAYLGKQLRVDGIWLTHYRAVVARIPEHSRVLPVYTGAKLGNVRPSLHAASFAVVDRAAVIPYLFSGDTGAPMKYFRYLHRPYAPDEAWYNSRVNNVVDWTKVTAQYQFLLLMKPFDADRIPIAGRTIAENETVALVAIQ